MSRSAIPLSLLVVSGAIALAALVSCLLIVFFGVPPTWGTPGRAGEVRESNAAKHRQKLAHLVNLEKGIDANTPLKDVLEFLNDRYDVTFITDENAFAAIGVQKVLEQPVCLPKMVGVSLETVLRLLLGQIKGDVHTATFVVRGDHIEITTTYHTGAALWTAEGRRFVPIVGADFDRLPLDEALQDLSDQTGVNIVVDSRLQRQAHTEVTAHLHRVALDTAVRLLADMAGLRLVIMDNVLYVTSKENAQEIASEEERLAKKARETNPEANPLIGQGQAPAP